MEAHAAAGGHLGWRDWTYKDWNRLLVEHYFVATGPRRDEPVERIPATPEELAVAVDEPNVDPSSAVDAFIRCVREQIPYGEESFCGFCRDYQGWSPSSPEFPHFFGMLWFTCLIAYGYPRPELSFYPRLYEALGKKDNLQFRSGKESPGCLPSLWADVRAWTLVGRNQARNIRELVLPEDVGRRKANGYSWFLAFPHQRDRLELARCLWERELVGPEPPIEPVVAALQAKRERFSPEFREDLNDFVEQVLHRSGEAKSSAFWRAVRQEALQPSVTSEGERLEAKPTAGIVVFGSDEGLRPVLCAPPDWILPAAYERHELDEPIGTLTHYITTVDGSLAGPSERALALGELVGLAHRSLIKQGLLVLREVHADVYAVVSGTEADGAMLALVRDELVNPFCDEFGGTSTKSLVEGWWEVTGCLVRNLASLPAPLSRVPQLLVTMQSPRIAVAGGIRVPEGFYCFLSYLPRLRAYGAERVFLTGAGSPVPCTRTGEDGEWALPADHVPARGTVVVRAEWSQGGGRARSAETCISFVDYVLQDAPKPLRSGAYVLEGCGPPEIDVTGGSPVPLDLVTDDAGRSADLLQLDASARYLGAGVGEMAAQPSPGFDWMVVGPSRTPDLLVFVGRPDSPTPPADRRSPDAGDRRHWKQALATANVAVRVGNGIYARLDAYPALQEARAAYRRHANAVRPDAPACPITDLKSLETLQSSAAPAPETLEAINALTAWSVRKGGLTYNDASVLIEPLVGTKNPLAVQQVLRAWAECGLLDVVRDVRSGRLTIIARPPVVVKLRRGPDVEATVFGLVSDYRAHRLLDAIHASRGRVRKIEVPPPNPYQPRVHRLRGDPALIDQLADEAGISRGGWLAWPTLPGPPDIFNVQRAFDRLPAEEPPGSYKLNAIWNWEKLVFERATESSSGHGVEIQRRTHVSGASIYAVQSESRVACWSYVRNWALLFGYELSGRRPFRRDSFDGLSCEGLSPVHLPLPIARLCTLTGNGLPGPRFVGKKVLGYSYPFGRRLFGLIEKVIPPAWINHVAEGG